MELGSFGITSPSDVFRIIINRIIHKDYPFHKFLAYPDNRFSNIEGLLKFLNFSHEKKFCFSHIFFFKVTNQFGQRFPYQEYDKNSKSRKYIETT